MMLNLGWFVYAQTTLGTLVLGLQTVNNLSAFAVRESSGAISRVFQCTATLASEGSITKSLLTHAISQDPGDQKKNG